MRSPIAMVLMVGIAIGAWIYRYPRPLFGSKSQSSVFATTPEVVLGAYLGLRRDITHSRPVLVLCGAGAIRMVTPGFRASFQRQKQIVDSIIVYDTCPSLNLHYDSAHDVVSVEQLVLRNDTSRVEVSVQPGQMAEPPWPPARRRETFQWVHDAPNPGWMSLNFFGFQPRD